MPSSESTNTQFQGSFVKIADGDYALRVSGAIAGGSTGALEVIPPAVALTTSVTANGKVTTPAAAAPIAATANLAAGTWDVEVTSFITGTTVANLELDNLKFRIGATTVATIISPVSGTTGATVNSVFKIRVNIPVPTPVSVVAGALATTAAIYAATIIATRVS